MVIIQGFFSGAGASETAHIVDKVREDDLSVLQLLHPFRLPLQRDKAVVVDGAESTDHIRNGQSALTDQIVGARVIGIAQVHMLDIGTKIFDGGVGAFAKVPIGMVHIPQSTHIIAGKALQHGAQTTCVGINTAGLDENAHTDLLGGIHQRRKIPAHKFLIFRQRTGRHIGNMGVMGGLHQLREHLYALRTFRQIHRGIKAGNDQLLIPKLADGCRHLMLVEGAALFQHGVEFGQIIDLNAAKAHFQSGLYHFIPGEVGPAAGGKGEIHASSSS